MADEELNDLRNRMVTAAMADGELVAEGKPAYQKLKNVPIGLESHSSKTRRVRCSFSVYLVLSLNWHTILTFSEGGFTSVLLVLVLEYSSTLTRVSLSVF